MKRETVAVAGLWEFGWNTPIAESILWEFLLRDFKVCRWHMAPVSGIRGQEELLTEHDDLGPVLATYRAHGIPVIFLDEQGLVPLRTFAHPDQAVYVCGKANLRAVVAYGQPGDPSLRIETPCAAGLLWPHQALSIALYDREAKRWR